MRALIVEYAWRQTKARDEGEGRNGWAEVTKPWECALSNFYTLFPGGVMIALYPLCGFFFFLAKHMEELVISWEFKAWRFGIEFVKMLFFRVMTGHMYGSLWNYMG